MRARSQTSHLIRWLRAYVWNRKLFIALAMTSPAILATLGSLAMSASLDRRIAHLATRKDSLTGNIAKLDDFTHEVERLQLGRAALLLVMTNAEGDMRTRFMLDKLFRLNAMGAMRRMAAVIYPGDWAGRFRRYEDLVASDYASPDAVRELQAVESSFIADASRQLTAYQATLNMTAAKIDGLGNLKTMIITIGNALMYLLTSLVFLVKTRNG